MQAPTLPGAVGDHRTYVRTYYTRVSAGVRSIDRFYRRGSDRSDGDAPATMTMELESQEVVVETTTAAAAARAASAAHVRTTVALRLLAFAASLAAAVVVATNRQERWGITVTFKMFAVWEYVYIDYLFIAGIC